MDILTKEQARKYRMLMLILEDGSKKTLLPYNAFIMAEQEGKDLVCMSVTNVQGTQMPVCKLMDFAKIKYEKEKALKEQKKIQRQNRVETKEIQITYTIQLNDMKTKANKIQKILSGGDLVRIVMRLRGREMALKDCAMEKMHEMINLCSEFAQIRNAISFEGRDIMVVLERKPE